MLAEESVEGQTVRWREVTTVTANSRLAAVRQQAELEPGAYKALPARSWRTIRVREKRQDPVRTVEEVDE